MAVVVHGLCGYGRCGTGTMWVWQSWFRVRRQRLYMMDTQIWQHAGHGAGINSMCSMHCGSTSGCNRNLHSMCSAQTGIVCILRNYIRHTRYYMCSTCGPSMCSTRGPSMCSTHQSALSSACWASMAYMVASSGVWKARMKESGGKGGGAGRRAEGQGGGGRVCVEG